ncbi:MAG: ADOP family duplicated permease [Gemmatimonadales bacterium]
MDAGRRSRRPAERRPERRRFAASPAIVGSTIRLNGEPYEVTGVMGPGFRFPPFWATGAELWAPLPLAARASSRGESLRAFARLAPGVDLTRARAEMETVTTRLERQLPGSNRDIVVEPLAERVTGSVRPALLVLLAAVGFLLLIACANVAHLYLARSTGRRRDFVVRAALGAGRGDLFRQLLAESAVLALLAGALGLALAYGGARLLPAFGPESLAVLGPIAIDRTVLAFTLLVALATGIGFGTVPGLRVLRADPTSVLKGSDDAGALLGPRRVRTILVGSEFAFAMVLLVGAGLSVRTLQSLRSIDPGFDPAGVVSMVVSVNGSDAGRVERRETFYRELLDGIRALPGVSAASAINHLPLGGDVWSWSFWIEGRPTPPREELPRAAYRVVMPGYFETMRLPLEQGRDFDERDRADAPGAVIVNQTLARRWWPGESAVGKRLTLDPGEPDAWLEVIGVAHDVPIDGWTAEPRPEVYRPLAQSSLYLSNGAVPFSYLTFVARAEARPEATVAAVGRLVATLDRDVPVSDAVALVDVIGAERAEPRFYLLLLGTFGGLAMLLAGIGIYGVLSHMVGLRTREIGIRQSLGASPRSVVRLVVGDGLAMAGLGVAAGALAAALLTRLMRAMLHGVTPLDPATFAAVAAILALLALAACALPAWRAARIDPRDAVSSG